ncbi:MAG: ABC transporter permease subunit [Chloroflexi bacterium]|nr:ABC transporter permease subunit [Chloroflexota bacterium]
MSIWHIAQRELHALFAQPIAYIVAIVILFFCGLIFADGLAQYQQTLLLGQPVPPPTMSNVLGFFVFISLFVSPAITMRLLAEEHKSGTIELLLTLPVREGEVVLGKFLAAVLYYLLILACTLFYALVLWRFGNPDMGPMLTSYLGVVLAVCGMVALGVLASALTQSQIVAYMLGLALILVFYLSGSIAQSFTANSTATVIFTELSLLDHLSRLPYGILTAKDLAYFACLTAAPLLLAKEQLTRNK